MTKRQQIWDTYEAASVQPCPECGAGKHVNCDSTSWDFDTDRPTVCPCWFNNGGDEGGPCIGLRSVTEP